MRDALKQQWARALEAQRFDIVRREPLQARKEYATRDVVDVFVNDDQVRLIVTRALGDTRNETRASNAGRAYQVFVEQNAVTIVNYRVRAGEDVGEILREMEKEIAGR
ncbi:MAG: hypothetical protein HY868_09490 [Chloroflexi bacterium]|nr:hypothetical protein [Chloroflexota bacterium]